MAAKTRPPSTHRKTQMFEFFYIACGIFGLGMFFIFVWCFIFDRQEAIQKPTPPTKNNEVDGFEKKADAFLTAPKDTNV